MGRQSIRRAVYGEEINHSLGQRSAPGGIRTPNLLIRSQKLYPVELRAQNCDLICSGIRGRCRTREVALRVCNLYNFVCVFRATRSNMPRRTDPKPNEYESPTGQRPGPPVVRKLGTILTLLFGRADTCFSPAAIFFPSSAGKCLLWRWNGKFMRARIPQLRLASSVWSSPFPSLAFLPAGHLADRFSRKRIIAISQILSAILSAALAIVSWKHLAIPHCRFCATPTED